ncbi:MAG: hypothetical protein ACOY0R_06830 [Chloroflexota bacterium]
MIFMVCLTAKICKTPNQNNPAILPSMVKTFGPCVFHVSQQDTGVALFESLRVAFEDVEELLDDGLPGGIMIPNNDNAIHVSADGDVLIRRRNGLVIRCHGYGHFSGTYPASLQLYASLFRFCMHSNEKKEQSSIGIRIGEAAFPGRRVEATDFGSRSAGVDGKNRCYPAIIAGFN